jgi:hypothetical protein
MIVVKTAVSGAIEHLKTLYESSLLNDVLLEEVELDEDGRSCLITLGFSRPLPPNHKWCDPPQRAVVNRRLPNAW